MDVVLYTTDCPKCRVLEAKLHLKDIEFETISDMEIMERLGIMEAPTLEVDGEMMNFKEAVDWVNGR